MNGPAATTAVLSAGRRTGPAIFTWCPGMPLPTATFNPSCTNVTSAIAVHGATMNASIRYEATADQFGGIARATLAGGASQALRADTAMPVPCRHPSLGGAQSSCVVAFREAVIPPTTVGGGPVGVTFMTSPPTASSSVHYAAVSTGGFVTSVGAHVPIAFPADGFTHFGAPWTTGKVTVRAPLAGGQPQTWYLEGSDARVDGVGSISLVAGGLSRRDLTGDMANRYWMSFVVTAPSAVPAISRGGLLVLGTLLAVSTLWLGRRALRVLD